MAGPDDVPRRAGRVLPVDPRGRVLLLFGFDPADPGHPFWFTVRGGAGMRFRRMEEYFLLRVASCAVSLDGMDHLERQTVTAYRWRSPDRARVARRAGQARRAPGPPASAETVAGVISQAPGTASGDGR